MNIQDITLYIDISEFIKSRKTTGIQRVIRELLQRALHDTLHLKVLTSNPDTNNFSLLQNKEVLLFLEDIEAFVFTQQLPFALCETQEKYKFFLEVDTVWNASIKRQTLYKELKSSHFYIINFIYDLIPLLYPEYLYEASKVNFPHYLKALFDYSDLTVVNSKTTQKDLQSLHEISDAKTNLHTQILQLGSDFSSSSSPHSFTKYKELLQTDYILFVGTLEPRKKQLQLFEVFETLHKNYPHLHLIFIGKLGWGFDAFTKKLANSPLTGKKVHHLSNILDAELKLFYKHAYLVTYLSSYEGFGLPLVESLQYHKVTISSKNSSLAEFSSECVDFLIDNSHEALRSLLIHYLDNPTLLHNKEKEIKKAYKQTTWDDFYSKLLKILLYYIYDTH